VIWETSLRRQLIRFHQQLLNFVSHTIPDVAGRVISAIKSGGSKAIEIGGQFVDKSKEVMSRVIESAGKFFDKFNPLNNIGFYIVLGLGAFILIEFMNSPSGVALSRSAPMMVL